MAKATRSHLLEQLRVQADAVATKRLQELKLSREVFPTDSLDTDALDDLVNLMLAKQSQFLLRAPLRGFNR